MKILIIFNHEPYNGTDVTWNGLRLAGKLAEGGNEVRLFLMNDAVDIPSNFFGNDENRFLSAVMLPTMATIPKFNRMGTLCLSSMSSGRVHSDCAWAVHSPTPGCTHH